MSTDAKSFLDAVDQDPQLRAQLRGSLQHILNAAAEKGFTFSENDLRAELRAKWGMTTPPNYHTDPDTCFFG